ncbi:PLP-dependent aminotransferase family protein [Niallia circulans]|uniref:PLP-dependent aminotransferase family protein n=1 Tax=Niallia circulans TaxID=1397 RepID=A0A941GMU2_NIACI|nr:PLP-dependent aminotransferase family protein [Niallia circulans]EOR25824.1 GntR family transcriptional regulator with aminotransferase domain [Niallia nealsonii AAU1]MCB5239963.1 PLP-dependent aminotransferase family protein [Niallia circulans]
MAEIEWKPQKNSTVSLHQQITAYMKTKIQHGEWTIGMKLPSQRNLAKQFQVNRSTIVAVLEELAADGLMEAKVGSGTKIINNTWGLLAATPPPDWISYVKSGIHQPNISIIQEINKAEANPHMIRLGTGELSPELLPKGRMEETFQFNEKQSLSLGYTEPKGSFALRQTVSAYLSKKGIIASSESILIVSGGLQALQLLSIGLLKRGSTIFHETPSYLNSIHIFQSAGMHLLGLPLDEEGVTFDTIGRLKKQHKAGLLYTIPNFHNPTGIVMSERRRKDLIAVSQMEKIPIIEDDVYGDLWLDTPPPKPLKAHDFQGNVLYIGSMSKSLSPGLRIGWIVGPEAVIGHLADIKMQTDYGSSTLSQFAVEKWLSKGWYEEFLINIRDELRHRRDFTNELLKKYFSDIATWKLPKGGFYIWLKLKLSISSQRLFSLALKDGILINPGIVYDKTDDQHLRLSYSYASFDELERGLITLAQIIKREARGRFY